MLSKKIQNSTITKLSKTLKDLENNNFIENTGFIQNSKKSSLLKTKSFRLREADLKSFANIVSYVNSSENRKEYSDSQVIRGLINYISDNVDSNIKKVMPYIRSSS